MSSTLLVCEDYTFYMSIENIPDAEPASSSAELPESEAFQPIELISELNPESGSTFTVLSKDGVTPIETGMIRNIVEDENFVGGGYLELDLKNAKTNEMRSGKLAFSKFIETYNNSRVVDFLNPEPQSESQPKEEPHTMDALTKRPLSASDAELLQRSRLAESPQSPILPEFTSYLKELIERHGTDTVRNVVGQMKESNKDYLRARMREGNLPGFTHVMEMVFEDALDPGAERKRFQDWDDAVSTDPAVRDQGTRNVMDRIASHVALTESHRIPKNPEDAKAAEEYLRLLTKLLE